MTSHSLDDASPRDHNGIHHPSSAGPQHTEVAEGRRGTIRRRSSIAVPSTQPESSTPSSPIHNSSPPHPQQHVGDNATRPHFLKERSATMYQRVTTSTMQPSGAHSRASSFLVGLVEKSRVTTSPFEPKPSVVTSNLHPEPQGPTGDHATSTLPSTPSLSSQNSRRKSMLIADGSHMALVGRLQQHAMGPQAEAPVSRKPTLHSIRSGLALSTQEEDDDYMTEDELLARSARDLVKDLTLYKKRSGVLLRVLSEIHRRLQHAEMVCSSGDEVDVTTLCKDLVEDGLLTVVVHVLREFRFHVELQTAAVSLLSHIADVSDLYAYMMVELDVEPVVQKTVAVHVSQERLVMAGSSLCHAIAEVRHKTDVAKLHRARAAEKEKKRAASFVEAFAAGLIAARSRASVLRVSKSATQIQGRDINEGELPQRRMSGSSPGPRLTTASNWQRRAMTAELGAPPTLDSHYQLECPVALHHRRRVTLVPPLERDGSEGSSTIEAAVCGVARPVTSPDPMMRGFSSSLESIYLQSPLFVAPSPLGKRIEMRRSQNAAGVKKRPTSRGGRYDRLRIDDSHAQQVEKDASRDEDCKRVSVGGDQGETLVDQQREHKEEDDEDCYQEESRQDDDEAGEEDRRKDGEQNSEEDDEDPAYDDDFTPEDDAEEPTERLLPVGSDGELIDLVEAPAVHEVNPANEVSTFDREYEDLSSGSGRLLGTGSDSELVAIIDAMQEAQKDETSVQEDESSVAIEDPLTLELVGILDSCVQSVDSKTTPQRIERVQCSRIKKRQVGKKKNPPSSPLAATWIPPSTIVRPVSRRIMDKSYKSNRRKSPGKRTCNTSSSSIAASSKITAILKKIDTADEEQHDVDTTPIMGLVLSPRSVEKQHQRPQTTASIVAQIQSLYARGLQLHKINDIDGAIRCYEQGIALQKTSNIAREFASLYINLGSAMMAQSKLTEALRAFEEAERIQPQNTKAVFNSALVLIQLDMLEDAAERLAQVVALNPEHVRAQSLLNECQRGVAKIGEMVGV